MIMINGNWEQVKDLSDVLRVVSENIGDEFAQKIEEMFLIKSQEMFDRNILISDYTKEELADMIIDLYETTTRNNKTIHILLENCERLDKKIKQINKER